MATSSATGATAIPGNRDQSISCTHQLDSRPHPAARRRIGDRSDIVQCAMTPAAVPKAVTTFAIASLSWRPRKPVNVTVGASLRARTARDFRSRDGSVLRIRILGPDASGHRSGLGAQTALPDPDRQRKLVRPLRGAPVPSRHVHLLAWLGNNLAILEHCGSIVEDRKDHLVVRTPHNPDVHWGNCLFVTDEDTVGDARRWVDTFQSAFP